MLPAGLQLQVLYLPVLLLVTCVVQQDVLWLEVPVDVAQQVQVLQRHQHLSSIELHMRLLHTHASGIQTQQREKCTT